MSCRWFMVLIVSAGACVSAARSDDGPPVRILLIATAYDHPWATHMYRDGCDLLAACLNQSEGVEAVVCPDFNWPDDPSMVDDIDALVLYTCAGGDIVLAPERAEAFRALMKKGVGYSAVHWSTATNDAALGPEYLGVLGGWFHFDHSGLNVSEQQLVQLDPESPVCRGWDSYPIHDEFYLNLKFAPEAHPVLKVDVEGREQVVAWTMERTDGGRSFGTTLAHFWDNFRAEAFRRFIVNGILWSAGVEVPEGGASVTVTDDDLRIPEAPPQK